MSLASRSLIPLATGLLLTLGTLVVPSPSTSASTTLCTGWKGCPAAGYSDAGYGAANGSSYWRMFAGHNCTNYVAYRMIRAGMSTERPFAGTGNAFNWGLQMASATDQTPTVGAVAWWNKNVPGAGSAGHVAYVEQVVSPTEIVVSEDNYSGDFRWRRITKGAGWPSGFIHLAASTAGPVASPVANPVVNTAPVTITGTPQVGATLGSTPGSWSPAASLAYQWYADGAPLASQTTPALAVTQALGGTTVVLRVVASMAGYASTTADSAPVTVGLASLSPAAVPRVTASQRNPVVGTTLTADQPGFAPAPRAVTVQWAADGVPIAGATDWSYRLADTDVARSVSAVVTARRPGYSPTPVASATVGPVVAGRVGIAKPFAVSGPARIGRNLRITGGGATSPTDATTTYVWRRDGAPIDGATAASYRITEADGGAQLSAVVAVVRDGWLSRRSVVTRDAVVAAAPRFTVRTTSKGGRTAIRFRVEAPGVARPAGPATVSVAGLRRTVMVRKGVGRTVLRGLAPGRRELTITWNGTAKVVAGSSTTRVRISS